MPCSTRSGSTTGLKRKRPPETNPLQGGSQVIKRRKCKKDRPPEPRTCRPGPWDEIAKGLQKRNLYLQSQTDHIKHPKTRISQHFSSPTSFLSFLVIPVIKREYPQIPPWDQEEIIVEASLDDLLCLFNNLSDNEIKIHLEAHRCKNTVALSDILTLHKIAKTPDTFKKLLGCIHGFDLERIELCPSTIPILIQALQNNPTLEALDISANKLGPQDVTAILKSLKGNRTLRRLNLRDNYIGEHDTQAAKTLAKLITDGMPLEHLSIAENDLGSESVITLVESLKSCRTLKFLDLACASINHTSAKILAEYLDTDTNLEFLDFSDCQLSLVTIQTLVEVLTKNSSLRYLNFADNKLEWRMNSAILRLLQQNPKLKILDFLERPLDVKTTLDLLEHYPYAIFPKDLTKTA